MFTPLNDQPVSTCAFDSNNLRRELLVDGDEREDSRPAASSNIDRDTHARLIFDRSTDDQPLHDSFIFALPDDQRVNIAHLIEFILVEQTRQSDVVTNVSVDRLMLRIEVRRTVQPRHHRENPKTT